MEALFKINEYLEKSFNTARNSTDEVEQLKQKAVDYSFAQHQFKKKYKDALKLSIGTAEFLLERLFKELNEEILFRNQLKQRNLPIDSFYYDTYQAKKLIDYFEFEYFMIEGRAEAMPKYLKDKIKKIKEKDLVVYHKCISSLLYAAAKLSTPKFTASLSDYELRSIAETHKNTYIDYLIGKEALLRAKQNIYNFEFAKKLCYSDRVNPYNIEPTVDEHQKNLFQEIETFVNKNGSESIRCQLMKKKIEDKLGAYSTWKLGWAGSRYKIKFNGINYIVPHGVSALYQLAAEPEKNQEKILELLREKTTLTESTHSFFYKLTGRKRFEETQETYNEFAEIMNDSILDLNIRR